MKRYFDTVWLGVYSALIGMKITIKHLFVRNVTVQYPNVHPTVLSGSDRMPDNARNRLFLEMPLCNGCSSCNRACPVNCITVETCKVVPEDTDKPTLKDGAARKLWVTKYDIDFAKCCFCGLCTESCPTKAIRFTTEFEYSSYNRNELIYHFSELSTEQASSKKKMLDDFNAKQKAAKDAAEKNSQENK